MSSDCYESAVAKHIKAQNRKRLDWCQLVVPVITPQSEEDMLAEIKAITEVRTR